MHAELAGWLVLAFCAWSGLALYTGYRVGRDAERAEQAEQDGGEL